MSDPPHEVFEAWQRAVDHWDDPASHEALLIATMEQRCFAWTAARYKERAGDPTADRELRRVEVAATATLLGTPPKRDRSAMPYRSSIVALVVLIAMIVIGVVYSQMMERAHVPPVTRRP